MTISQTDMEREYYEGRIKARRDANALQAHWAALETNVKALEADVKVKQASVKAQQAELEAKQADWDAKQAERDAMQAERDAAAALAAAEAEWAAQALQQIARAEQKGELVERITTLQRNLNQDITPRTELRAMSIEDLDRLAQTLDQQAPRS